MNASYKAILEEFLSWLDTLGYGKDFINGSKYRIDNFLEWLETKGICEINQLTDKHIKEYHKHLETRPNRVFKGHLLSTRQLYCNHYAIDKLLEFLHQYGMTSAPVPLNVRPKIDNSERVLQFDILTQQEIKTLYNCIPDTYQWLTYEKRQPKQYELKLIFALYYGCGLRRSEGYNLQLQDVDFDRKTIFVRQGKNYKDRIVPMSDGVYRELQDYIYNFRKQLKLDHNRLFICIPEAQLKRLQYLQNVCNNETIKTKRITLHTLRHSIATHLLQNGMSIENIALFLGHSSLDSTQIYTHIANG